MSSALAPGNRASIFDMVDGEETARITIELFFKEKLSFLTYHISNGINALTVGDVIDLLEMQLQTKITIEFCGDVETFLRRLWWKTLFRPRMRVVYTKISSYLLEPAYSKVFDSSNLLKELQISALEPKPKEVFLSLFR